MRNTISEQMRKQEHQLYYENHYDISEEAYFAKVAEPSKPAASSQKRLNFIDYRNEPFAQKILSYVNETHFAVSLTSGREFPLEGFSVELESEKTPPLEIGVSIVDAHHEQFTCELLQRHGDGFSTWIYQFLVKIDNLSLNMEGNVEKMDDYFLLVHATQPSNDDPNTTLKFTLPTTFSPNSPTSDQAYTILSYGDMNVNDASRATMLNLLTQYNNDVSSSQNPLKMIIHQGDIPYAWDSQQRKWDSWARQVAPLTKHVFYQAGPGNHEKSSFCQFESFEKRFTPWWGKQSGSNTNLWYSFDYLGIHWVSLSSEHPYNEDTPQYEWFVKDLSQVDRKKTPFIVFYAHRPMYSSNNNHGSDETLRKWIQPQLEKNNVDLALFGHVHAYERAFHNGTIYVESGTAGYDLNPQWDEPVPEWSQFRETSHGFLRLTVTPFKRIQVEYLRNNFKDTWQPMDASPIVADSFFIESRYRNKESVAQEDGGTPSANKATTIDADTDSITLLNAFLMLALLSAVILCCLFGYLMLRIFSRRARHPQEFQMLHQEFDFSSDEDTSVGDVADPRFSLDDSDEEAV